MATCKDNEGLRSPCNGKTTTDKVFYSGPVLPCTDIQTNEELTSIIQKIDFKLCNSGIQNNFVRELFIDIEDLPDPYTEQDICDYILALPNSERTIAQTDSKWNVIIQGISSIEKIYEIQNIGEGLITFISPANLLLINQKNQNFQEVLTQGNQTILQAIFNGDSFNPQLTTTIGAFGGVYLTNSLTNINTRVDNTGIISTDIINSLSTSLTSTGITFNNGLLRRNILSTGFSNINLPQTNGTEVTLATIADVIASSTPDATASVKGKLKLTNDLGGTADLPTTPTAIHITGNETKTGQLIVTPATTSLNAIQATSSTGYGVQGFSNTLAGVQGLSPGSGIGVWGAAMTGTGVFARSGSGTALIADIVSGTKIASFTLNSIEVANILGTGQFTGNMFVKTGGISIEFLKADGSVTIIDNPFIITALGYTPENIANKGIVNGYASLDSGGKVPVSQLPNSIMEYKGNYNALTNTPTLVNGIGDTGDVYRVSVAGPGVNGLNFVVGDYVIYNGTTWEKSHAGEDSVLSVFGRAGIVVSQSGDYTASQITNIPFGNITSTNVQAALNELDTIKANNTDVIHTTGNETKTGNLTVNAIIKSGGTSSQFLKADGSIDSTVYTGVSRTLNINGNIFDLSSNREWRVAQADTGILTFASPGITVASGTQVNITAVTGWVVNNETNPAIPTSVFISYPGATNVTVPTIGSGLVTYIMLLPNGLGGGTLVFQNTLPTSAQRKTHLWLGKAAHPLGIITVAGNEPDFITSPLAQYRDMFQALGPYINDGIIPYPNGANLTINVTTGNVHGNGINFVADRTNPDEILVSGAPISFLPRTQTGNGGVAVTNVDVQNYDVGGVVTAIPGPNARSTIRYIYYIPNLGFLIQYGQQWYPNLSDAIAAVGKETQIIYPPLANNSILIGVLVARKDATLLNNTAQAQFFPADKLGQIIGATSGVSVGTRQTSYNNSVQPQTIVNDTLGADTWRNGRALDTSIVMQWQNIAGTTTASINGLGNLTANSFIKTGGLSTEYLKADGSVSTLTNPVTGTGTINTLPKWNTTSTQGNSQVVDNGTNVQLAIADSKLIGGDNSAVGRLVLSNYTTTAYLELDGSGNTTPNKILLNTTTGVIAFSTNSLERMRIANDGNVGIGTATPGTTPNNTTLGFINGSNIQARITAGFPQLALSSNVDGDYYNATYKVNGYAAQIVIDPANMGNNANGIGFNLAPSGTAGGAITWQRAMTIVASGNVGIGVTAPTANLHIAASTTAKALMRLTVGSAPTIPNDGDVWLESNTNTGLKIRIAGVTKTINLV